MPHWKVTLLFTEIKGRSMELYIEFDEVEVPKKYNREEHAISVGYRKLRELGFNGNQDNDYFLNFNEVLSMEPYKYL